MTTLFDPAPAPDHAQDRPCGDDHPVPVVLSMGMGIDSAAILTRWVREPASRDFDLADLVVITSMVGDEFAQTGELMRTHLLPLMAEHGIRYVQVARGGPAESDGIVVLADTRTPDELHLGGVYRLSDELRATGTVPQVAARRCSIKFKGWVLDSWLRAEFGERNYRHVIGFAAEETRRAERDLSYSGANRHSEYPLIDWGWDRDACRDYLRAQFAVEWTRSCCSFCPFAGAAKSRPELLERWAAHPSQAADALLLEHTARALNPASTLFGTTAALDVAAAEADPGVLAAYEARLDSVEWALYRVRRILLARRGDATGKGPAWRSVTPLATGTREQAHAELRRQAAALGLRAGVDPDGVERAWGRRRGDSYPTTEELFVVAPAHVAAKERAAFAVKWAQLTGSDDTLFGQAS